MRRRRVSPFIVVGARLRERPINHAARPISGRDRMQIMDTDTKRIRQTTRSERQSCAKHELFSNSSRTLLDDHINANCVTRLTTARADPSVIVVSARKKRRVQLRFGRILRDTVHEAQFHRGVWQQHETAWRRRQRAKNQLIFDGG